MLMRGTLDECKRCQHGPRFQEKAIEHVAKRFEILEAIQSEEEIFNISLKLILEDFKKCTIINADI